MPAREKGNQIKHASVPAAHPTPAPSASERVHGSRGVLCHTAGDTGVLMSQGEPPFLGQIRVNKEAASKWWASSCCLHSWGVSKEPQPHTDHVLGFPLPPSRKAPACRVLGTHAHPGCVTPPVPRVLGGGAGPAKRIYCSTQGALEAITFPPLDLNGFETSKRIEGAGCQAAAPKG